MYPFFDKDQLNTLVLKFLELIQYYFQIVLISHRYSINVKPKMFATFYFELFDLSNLEAINKQLKVIIYVDAMIFRSLNYRLNHWTRKNSKYLEFQHDSLPKLKPEIEAIHNQGINPEPAKSQLLISHCVIDVTPSILCYQSLL